MKQLVIFPRGALQPKDKERMAKAGFLAIEADDPSKVIVAIPGQSFGDTDLLKAALQSMCEVKNPGINEPNVRSLFVHQLWDSMKPKTETLKTP